MSPRRMVAVAALVCGAVTAAVAFSPELYFAYDRPELHLILETTEGLIALLVLYLLTGRMQHTGEWSDALLVYALGVLGGTNLLVALIPAVSAVSRDALLTWGPLVTRLVGALVFTAAAFAPTGWLLRGPGMRRRIVLAVVATIVGMTAFGYAFGPSAPLVSVDGAVPDPARPFLSGHPAVHTAQLISIVTFAVAAIGFLRRAERHDDELMGWIAVAAIVSSFARVNYFLFPSLYSELVYSGDLLRLASYLLMLVGASREIRAYWRQAAAAVVAEERRRIARDLHDGLAQELSFVTGQARRLAKRPELAPAEVQLQRIVSAGQRALDESRRAIDYLAHPHDEPLDALLSRAAEQVAARVGTHVRSTMVPEVHLDADAAEQLVRIVREAVTNAARHGEADLVLLSLSDDGEVVVIVEDDGKGFDVAAARRQSTGRFGLTSMHERAAALGGTLTISSQPGTGTTVEVRIPSQTQSEF